MLITNSETAQNGSGAVMNDPFRNCLRPHTLATRRKDLVKQIWMQLGLGVFFLLMLSCGGSSKNDEALAYLDAASPLLESHAVLTESTNKANVDLANAASSGNQARAFAALKIYRDKLDEAVVQTRREIVLWRQLVVPAEFSQFHRQMIEALLKEVEGLQGLSSSYSATLVGNSPDPRIINDANILLRDATLTWVDLRQQLQRMLAE